MLNIFMKVGFILLLILLIINIFAYVLFGTADEPVTFSALLDQLSNAPTLDIALSEIANNMQITKDWGSLNFVRDFINFFSYLWAFFVWLGVILYNVVVGIGYFLYLIGLQGFSAYL